MHCELFVGPALIGARSSRCFRCFGRELSASGIPFSGEILDFRRSPVMEKQREARSFSLFLAVLCAKFETREVPSSAQRVQREQYQETSILSI
jgi:hypothetical protein